MASRNHTSRPAPRVSPPAPIESRINIWLSAGAIIIPLLGTVGIGLVALGSITTTIKDQIAAQGKDVDLKLQPVTSGLATVSQKVDSAAKDAQNKVDLLSGKVDAANALTQAKQDALTKDFQQNQTEQQTFRANVQNLFDKVFTSQTALAAQVNQERVDRLTDQVKKK